MENDQLAQDRKPDRSRRDRHLTASDVRTDTQRHDGKCRGSEDFRQLVQNWNRTEAGEIDGETGSDREQERIPREIPRNRAGEPTSLFTSQ